MSNDNLQLLPSNKKFGLFFSILFLIGSIYFIYNDFKSLSIFLFLLSIGFIIITILKENLLLPINKLWLKIGLLIGSVVSPIVLGLIYFLIFSPISIFMQTISRDELKLKFKKKNSHWKKRDNIKFNSFKDQF